MTPEQFNERLAHYAIDPWGDDWMAAATVARQIDEQTGVYVSSKTGKKSKQTSVIDYIPMPAWQRARYKNDEARQRIQNSNGSHRNDRG